MSLFLAADACLSWSLPSIAEQQVSPHRLPMQYWLKNHWLSSNTPHIPTVFLIQQSCVSYISLLSDLWACVHGRKKWHRSAVRHSSSVSSSNRLVWLQTWKKVIGWCTAQWKMLLFCVKRVTQIWTSLSEEEKHFGRLVSFWFGTFAMHHWVCCSSWKHSKINGRVL